MVAFLKSFLIFLGIYSSGPLGHSSDWKADIIYSGQIRPIYYKNKETGAGLYKKVGHSFGMHSETFDLREDCANFPGEVPNDDKLVTDLTFEINRFRLVPKEFVPRAMVRKDDLVDIFDPNKDLM